jgi:hypothetical protein
MASNTLPKIETRVIVDESIDESASDKNCLPKKRVEFKLPTDDEEDDEYEEEDCAKPSMNQCVICGVDMGPMNPRQLCGKFRCSNK